MHGATIKIVIVCFIWSIFMFPESEKDTKAPEVTAITFEPALKTFEMDIMEQMGIKEDRVPAKTYWY